MQLPTKAKYNMDESLHLRLILLKINVFEEASPNYKKLF